MELIFNIIFLLQDSLMSSSSGGLNDITFNLSNIIKEDGLLISIVGYVIVFVSLVLLWFFIVFISKLLTWTQRKRLKDMGHRSAEKKDLNVAGEISAAIAMALYQHYQEVHDFEDTVLTIKRIQKVYSPWSSKLYNLTQDPGQN